MIVVPVADENLGIQSFEKGIEIAKYSNKNLKGPMSKCW